MPDASDLGAPEETTNGEASPLKVTDQELGELTDQRLMSMVRGAGDDDVVASRAFGELYRRRYDEVFRQATFRLRDRHQAEEITSEAMFKTYRALRGGKGPSDSFVGYVMTAVRSETIRSAEESMLTDPMEHEELESVAEVPDESFEDFYSEREQLCNAFRELPAKSRRALWLLEVEGQSVERTAELFHMNEGSVRQLSFRARESFRALYLQQHVDVAPERCQPTASLLGRYVRGTLKGSRFEAVADHVAHCERCTDQVARLKRLNSLLRVSIGPVLIGAAAGTGYGIYGAGTVQAGVAAAITDRTGAARKWWTAGVAAAILLMIGGGSAWVLFNGTDLEAAQRPDTISNTDPAGEDFSEPENEESGEPTDGGTSVTIPGQGTTTTTPPTDGPERKQPTKEPWEDDTTPYWFETDTSRQRDE